MQTSGVARTRNYTVIASAAKQSIVPQRGRLDCFASLAMTWSQPRYALYPHPEEPAKRPSRRAPMLTAENS